MKTILTGMTRDGVFLVESGVVKCGVKNFRFTQSILEALENTEEIGNQLKLIGQWGSNLLVPSLLIKDFNFTSKTRY
jgi:predicted Zn-dependent protease